MTEQADSCTTQLVFYYSHKRIKTSDGCIKTEVAKFIDADFFGSSYPSNRQLQQTEDKLRAAMRALMERKLKQKQEQLCILQQAISGELADGQYRKRLALDIVERYIVNKETDEVHKLKEDFDKILKAMRNSLPSLLSSPPPPLSQPAIIEAKTPQLPEATSLRDGSSPLPPIMEVRKCTPY